MDRRLIINCDDFGSILAANEAVEQALSRGVATSATVMIPCPWAYDAVQRARAHPDWAVGVHLTLTGEWARYRWRPLLPRERVPGLYGPDGFMWPRVADVHAHASPGEALEECVAQVECALAWGLRPTHLDSHMGTLQTHPAFYAVYLEVAARFGLPVRMAGERELREAATAGQLWAQGVRAEARARGVRFANDLVMDGRRLPGEDARAFLLRVIAELPAGTTEVLLHPAVDGPELRAVTGGGQDRARDLHLLTEDREVREALAAAGVRLVSYRAV